MQVNASRHNDNSTGGSILSEPLVPSTPQQPTPCSNDSSSPCPSPSQPAPPSLFLCPDGTNSTTTNFKGCNPNSINCGVYPSIKSCPSQSLGGSSGGSSSSKGSSSGSSSSLSKADIKLAILQCISNNVTAAIQATSNNKTQATNQTFLNLTRNNTAGCIPSLLSSHTHHTTTIKTQPKLLRTGTVSMRGIVSQEMIS